MRTIKTDSGKGLFVLHAKHKNEESPEKMQPSYKYSAKVNRVIDGDTIDVDLSIGFNLVFRTKLRLLGVNTPEIHAMDEEVREKAKKAKNYADLTLSGKKILVETEKADAFGRYLATVFVQNESGEWYNFNETLITGGYAIIFKG